MKKISGFVGCYSDSEGARPSLDAKPFFKEIINDYQIYSSRNYCVICSKEFISSFSDSQIKIESGKTYSPDSDKLVAQIEFSDGVKAMRDFWGVRTIYYCLQDNGILISSDIRFILPLLNSIEYDYEAICQSSMLGFIYDSERTLFANIRQVPPNFSLAFKNEKLSIKKNHVPLGCEKILAIEDAVNRFSEVFEKKVENALTISSKKAFLLSGGMDSSALAMAGMKFEKIEAVTFVSEGNTEDAFYANALSQKLGCVQHIIEFSEKDALNFLPEFINSIENIELEGIFSPLGGYAYYLMCKEISKLGFRAVFPGEGADELLGGYYWPLTHTFGFVDKLKEKTRNSPLYDKIVSLFPSEEERISYRKIAYSFFQGSALTNYHLNCIEHTAKSFDLINYPVFMISDIWAVLANLNIDWLCDGKSTKIILRKYLNPKLKEFNLDELAARKKLAMPSVITSGFKKRLEAAAFHYEGKIKKHPFAEFFGKNVMNYFMFDIFHKYFSEKPLGNFDILEWREDLQKLEVFNESIVHW